MLTPNAGSRSTPQQAPQMQDADTEVRETTALLARNKPAWEKVLWKKQPYPDNYVPDSFLSALQTNTNLYLPRTATLIHFSLPISIHFNLVMTFIGTYIHLLNGSLSSLTLCVFSTSTSVLGWSLCSALPPHFLKSHSNHSQAVSQRQAARRSKRGPVAQQVGRLLSLLLLALVLFALSPVLRTLTEATTSDSIWALSAALFCLNMATADYSTTHLATRSDEGRGKQGSNPSVNAGARANDACRSYSRGVQQQTLSNQRPPVYIVAGQNTQAGGGLAVKVSLNAAVCASVVLASRLRWNGDVFALLLFSMQVFALVPIFRARMIGIFVERHDRLLRRRKEQSKKRRDQADGNASELANGDITASYWGNESARAPAGYLPNPVIAFQVLLFSFSLMVALGLFLTLDLAQGTQETIATQRDAGGGARSAVAIHIGMIAFVSIVCPMWMRHLQRHKRRLHGPWDPAVPIIRAPEF